MDRDLDTSNATEPMRFCNDRSRIVHTVPAPSEVGMTEPLVLTITNIMFIHFSFTTLILCPLLLTTLVTPGSKEPGNHPMATIEMVKRHHRKVQC